jgi:hypothetical protein
MSHARYRLQYQPRRIPGDPMPRVVPQLGNDKWATAEDNLTATQAVARLVGTGALNRINRAKTVSQVHIQRGISSPSSAVMDDTYFYRVVPVDVEMLTPSIPAGWLIAA